MSAGESRRVIVISLMANVGIAISKLVAAFISGSAAMMAESIHSIADSANQILLLVGNKKALKKPSLLHPLGYGRENFFWSFVVALILFSMGGLFAIYDGIHKLYDPHTLERPDIVFIVLGIAIILESFSFIACWKEVQSKNTEKNIWNWFKTTGRADLLVIFSEDTAALAGLVIAIITTVLSLITGNVMWDAFGSILIGLLLVAVSILLAFEVKSLIIGEASSEIDVRVVESIATRVLPGSQILRFISQQSGVNEILIAYKIHPGPIRDVAQLIQAINTIETEVRNRYPMVKWQFVEPDYFD